MIIYIGCVYPCETCSDASTCNTCRTLGNRVSVDNCDCENGYYDDDT